MNGVTNVAMESGKPLDNCAESRVETNQEGMNRWLNAVVFE